MILLVDVTVCRREKKATFSFPLITIDHLLIFNDWHGSSNKPSVIVQTHATFQTVPHKPIECR